MRPTGAGSGAHLGAALFERVAACACCTSHSGGAAVTGLLNGEAQLLFSQILPCCRTSQREKRSSRSPSRPRAASSCCRIWTDFGERGSPTAPERWFGLLADGAPTPEAISVARLHAGNRSRPRHARCARAAPRARR